MHLALHQFPLLSIKVPQPSPLGSFQVAPEKLVAKTCRILNLYIFCNRIVVVWGSNNYHKDRQIKFCALKKYSSKLWIIFNLLVLLLSYVFYNTISVAFIVTVIGCNCHLPFFSSNCFRVWNVMDSILWLTVSEYIFELFQFVRKKKLYCAILQKHGI